MKSFMFDEMSVLNNELVNTQRILAKQNAEITRLHDQLKLVNVELEQFTYVISHDLKEPLRMVTSFMELLKRKHSHELDEKAQVYINYALDGSRRMRKMIDDLLELSQIGHEKSIKESTDLNLILKEVKENILTLTKDTGAVIITETKLPVLFVYPSEITRLLQNVLSNAIKFRNKEIPLVIHLAAKEEREAWEFSMQDNGIGIEKTDFEKIFEIFTRLHKRDTYEGLGIGLAVCKKLVQHHGGKIWIESEIGKGTTVHFTLLKQHFM